MQIQKPADLARIVKSQRQSQVLIQKDVADTVGITRQSLARIERGHGGASFETVLRIFEQLNIRLEAHPEAQRHNTVSVSTQNTDVSFRAVTAALETVTNTINSPLAAATAATQNTDSALRMSNWQSSLDDLANEQRQRAAKSGYELSAPQARKVALNAAIEAGNPDCDDSA